MLPSLSITAAGSIERWLLAGLLLASGLIASAAFLRRRSQSSSQRIAMLVGVYLCGALALLLAVHALHGGPDLVVSPYAAVLVLSISVAWAVALPRLRAIGLPLSLIFQMIFGCLLLGFLGSRLAHALSVLSPESTLGEFVPRLLDRQQAGLGLFGAVLFDGVYLIVLFRRYPEHSLLRSLDASALPITLNVAIGRAGCLLAGCCFGTISDPGWFRMPLHAFHASSPVAIAYREHPGAVVWATQPLELLAVFAIACAGELAYRKRAALALQDGTVIAFTAASYGAVRGLLEFVRGDSPRSLFGIFTVWQLLGFTMFVAASSWLVLSARSRPIMGSGSFESWK